MIYLKTKLKQEPSILSSIVPTRRNKLKLFLYQNKLYQKQEGEISLSSTVKWKQYVNDVDDKILELVFQKTASPIDEKLADLIPELQALFNAPVLETINNLNDVIYKLLIKRSDSNPIILDDRFEESADLNSIILDKYSKWDLINIPALLLCGATGSGKSRVAYSIIKQFLSITNDITVIDPKRHELQEVARHNFGLSNVFTEPEKMKQAIENYYKEMMNRFLEIEEKQLLQSDLTYKLLVIDEYANLKTMFPKKEAEEIEKHLILIASLARACNMRLVLITQTPSVDNISANLRNNMNIRIMCGNPANPEMFKMAMGINRTEEQLIHKNAGEGYIYLNGKVKDFSSPRILFPREIEN